MLRAHGKSSLAFSGNSRVGIYGAGAFQTLANRDLVRPSDRLFIVGGGNVGLIAGYHALQAGIGSWAWRRRCRNAAATRCTRISSKRLGVPIYTRAHDSLRKRP